MTLNSFVPKSGRAIPAAMGVLAGCSALLVASLVSTDILRAVQDGAAGGAGQTHASTLRVPADISEEAIEKVDAALASTVSPLLNTVFNASEPVDVRKDASGRLKAALDAVDASSEELASLKSRLVRRVALLDASLAAMTVDDLSSEPAEFRAALTQASAKTAEWLQNVRHGELWAEYLQLPLLQNPEATHDQLQQVLNVLSAVDGITPEQRTFLQRPQLLSLKAAVVSAVAATAVPEDDQAARTALTHDVDSLVIALLTYETGRQAHDAETARTLYRQLRSRFPAAAKLLRPEIMTHYFNHNVHFTVSEELLSRLVSDYRSESGRIADCIMGAWVTGSQVTSVNVRADIKPSATSARFVISADGNTQSNTIARKDPATVRTLGNHYFHVTKPVSFSGRQLGTESGSIHVDVNSRTVGVSTKYDGIPLFGGIIRNIARNEVAKSKAQSEAITARRLSDEALPKFENEVDNQLSELEASLRKTLDSLDARGVGPESLSARSSNSHIAVSSRTMGVSRLGGSAQPPVVLNPRGMAVQLHETALNNTIDALGFNGRTMPEKQVVDELEKSLSDLLQRDVKLRKEIDEATESKATPADGEPEPPTTFIFSKHDPIRAHFDNNSISLVLRTAVHQEGKEEIPEQVITIPIEVSMADGKLVLNPGTIGVNSREETSRVRQIARANQIRRILGKQIVRREMAGTFDVQAAGDRSLLLTLTRIQLADGWLTAEVQ